MIYALLADGFEETEAITPIDMLRRARCEVVTVGVTGKTVTSSHGIPMVADITIDEVDVAAAQGVILPGGLKGTQNLDASEAVHALINTVAEKGGAVAAICAAPSVLGKMGLLRGRKAVCYPGFEEYLTGAVTPDEQAVTDGNIITAKGAGASLEFGYELIKYFKGAEKADEIASQIIWKR